MTLIGVCLFLLAFCALAYVMFYVGQEAYHLGRTHTWDHAFEAGRKDALEELERKSNRTTAEVEPKAKRIRKVKVDAQA